MSNSAENIVQDIMSDKNLLDTLFQLTDNDQKSNESLRTNSQQTTTNNINNLNPTFSSQPPAATMTGFNGNFPLTNPSFPQGGLVLPYNSGIQYDSARQFNQFGALPMQLRHTQNFNFSAERFSANGFSSGTNFGQQRGNYGNTRGRFSTAPSDGHRSRYSGRFGRGTQMMSPSFRADDFATQIPSRSFSATSNGAMINGPLDGLGGYRKELGNRAESQEGFMLKYSAKNSNNDFEEAKRKAQEITRTITNAADCNNNELSSNRNENLTWAENMIALEEMRKIRVYSIEERERYQAGMTYDDFLRERNARTRGEGGPGMRGRGGWHDRRGDQRNFGQRGEYRKNEYEKIQHEKENNGNREWRGRYNEKDERTSRHGYEREEAQERDHSKKDDFYRKESGKDDRREGGRIRSYDEERRHNGERKHEGESRHESGSRFSDLNKERRRNRSRSKDERVRKRRREGESTEEGRKERRSERHERDKRRKGDRGEEYGEEKRDRATAIKQREDSRQRNDDYIVNRRGNIGNEMCTISKGFEANEVGDKMHLSSRHLPNKENFSHEEENFDQQRCLREREGFNAPPQRPSFAGFRISNGGTGFRAARNFGMLGFGDRIPPPTSGGNRSRQV